MDNVFTKDPDETCDYQINWATKLSSGSDTISTSAWTVPSGLTKVSSSNTTTTATVTLSGGTAGNVYFVENKIVTAAGRTYERSLDITVGER